MAADMDRSGEKELRLRCSVVIPSYNGASCIEECIDSVICLDAVDQVVVVDNASSDGTPDLVSQRYPNVVVVRNAHNLGFGGACNIGARSHSSPVSVFLNQDAIVGVGFNCILERLQEDGDLAIVGPRVSYPDGRVQLSQGRPFTWINVCSHWICYPLNALGFRGPWGIVENRDTHYAASRNPAWVAGSCMFVLSEAFMSVGGFSDQFFMYVEDVDLCHRFTADGWQVAFDPSCDVVHLERGGGGISVFAMVETIRGQAILGERLFGSLPVRVMMSILAATFISIGSTLMVIGTLCATCDVRSKGLAFLAGARVAMAASVRIGHVIPIDRGER
jgi:N-acetylglucosaminyl-diphospho-decaprenol L-rhamnosyltransferase